LQGDFWVKYGGEGEVKEDGEKSRTGKEHQAILLKKRTSRQSQANEST